MKSRLLITILFVAALAVAACSPQTAPAPTQAQPPTPAATAASSGSAVNIGQSDQLGKFLVDAKGLTLYLFLKDTPNTSNCYDACAKSWPPLLTTGSPVAGDGLDATKLGTTSRKDGATQVTYNGWPLYYFANDKQPGDTNGQDVKQVWYVISPAGDMVAATPMDAMPTATNASGAGGVAVTEGSSVSATIAGFAFDPGILKVHQGTTVTWTNNDGSSHTVTSDSGAFDSGALKQGASFSFTFNEAGTFAYHCNIHRSMTATVIVVP